MNYWVHGLAFGAVTGATVAAIFYPYSKWIAPRLSPKAAAIGLGFTTAASLIIANLIAAAIGLQPLSDMVAVLAGVGLGVMVAYAMRRRREPESPS